MLNLNEYLALDNSKLNKKTKNEIIIIAKKLKVTLSLNKKVKNKEQLIIDVLEKVSELKDMNKKEVEERINKQPDQNFDFNYLFNAYENNKNPDDIGQLIYNTYSSQKYAKSTLAKTKSKQLRDSIASLEKDYPDKDDLSEWCKKVYKSYRNCVKLIDHDINQDYEERVTESNNNEEIVYLDSKNILQWCNEVLTEFLKTGTDVRWYEVSLALAFTSGRRMDEIHGTCKFDLGEDNQLIAKGLSKKESLSGLTSPCLVHNKLWMDCYNALPETAKNRDNLYINQTISSSMSQTLKPWVYGSNRSIIKGIKVYKDSRDFYIAYCLSYYYDRKKHIRETRYVKSIIGHDSKKSGRSYEKFVVN